MYPVSACVFIKDSIKGAFCLFESMASYMPLVDDFVVLDLGSSDGTFDILREIADKNKKLRLYTATFPYYDAKVFADLANKVVGMAKNKNVLYYQSDEIPHERLIEKMERFLRVGKYNFALWRYQLKENFQVIKWFPHPVHRFGEIGKLNYTGDGMNTDGVFGVDVCSEYNQSWFAKWGKEYESDPASLPTHEMVLDVSMSGGFIENIPIRARLHSPFWGEQPNVEGVKIDEWYRREKGDVGFKGNPNWTKKETPFNIPKIMRYHVGKAKYGVREELIEALKKNETIDLLGADPCSFK